MSKGLSYALYLVLMNHKKPTEELVKILKPYKKELEALVND